MSAEKVRIELAQDEALVLFEWLARSDDAQKLPIEHPAEQKVLWKLEGILEKEVPVFSQDYGKLLDAARREVDLRN